MGSRLTVGRLALAQKISRFESWLPSQMLKNGFLVDGIRWVIGQHPPKAIPLCPKDFIELNPIPEFFPEKELRCEECGITYITPRNFDKEGKYILNKINSNPIAEDKKSSSDGKFFVTSRIMKSRVGLRLVVYAGEKGKKEKTQIFVEPEIRRLSFDQKDLHPTDVFTELEATFSDGTKASLKKKR